jgi:hypothetical protein
MSPQSNPNTPERRADVRLASGKKVEAAVVDQYEQPIALLRNAEVVNVSAGGMLLVSDTPAEPGTRMIINTQSTSNTAPSKQRLSLESLECAPPNDQQHRIRCKLVQGHIPAKLIYNW